MTMTGDILGTLRYMSPEQALAKRVVVDHRSDIYSLGVTLYELLTLRPAYTGDDRHELLRQIAFEEPRKLRQINARIPQDLETIVLKAIEKNPADRYATAQELADDLRRFLDDQPIKAKRQTLLATARKWSRRHRGLLVATAMTLLVSGLVLAGSIGWVARDRAARQTVAEATASLALDEATRLVEQKKWTEALLAVKRADDILASTDGGELTTRVQELRKDVEMVLRLEAIRLSPTTSDAGDILDVDPETDHKYAQTFRESGFDVESLAPSATAERIKRSSVRLELATALDTWAGWRTTHIAGDQVWKRLIEAARLADPDPWRNRLRDALDKKGDERKAALTELAASAAADNLPPRTIYLLAGALNGSDAGHRAVGPLRAAQRRHPDDFWINFMLGDCLFMMHSPHPDEAIRYFTVALALRPESAIAHARLGAALSEDNLQNGKGLQDEAIAHLREAVRLNPSDTWPHVSLGIALGNYGLEDKAIESTKEAIRLNPNLLEAHTLLSQLLQKKGLLDEAIANAKELVRLDPSRASSHGDLGLILSKKGLLDEAIASYREALRLDPNSPGARQFLCEALLKKGHLVEAIALTEKSLKRNLAELGADNPATFVVRQSLAVMYAAAQRFADAEQEYRACLAVSKDPQQVLDARSELAQCLLRQGKLDEGTGMLQDLLQEKLQRLGTPDAVELRQAWSNKPDPDASPRGTAGQAGLDFDGDRDYVVLPSLQFDGHPPWTIETIIKPVGIDRSALNGWTSLVSTADGGGIGLESNAKRWSLGLYTADLFSQLWKENYSSVFAHTQVKLNEWQHVAGVWDGQELRLYLNGELQETRTSVRSCTRISHGPFFLGADPDSMRTDEVAQGYFHGRMRAARISRGVEYVTSFTQPERLDKTPETIALYDFTTDTGRYAIDRSGHGHDGIIVGAKFAEADK
jgi:tetratricopeptide (TPR) repeat protein